MAAGGLVYTASFNAISVTNAAQNIWEIIAAAGTSLFIHSIRLTFAPTIVSGVAQDVEHTQRADDHIHRYWRVCRHSGGTQSA